MATTSSSSIDLPSLAHPDAWDAPILFNDFETADIPARLLPSVFERFATELANTTETAEALSVMTILGVISTAIAKRFVVSPKEGWLEPVNIYTLVALPPANHKSLVLQRCTKPLGEWEKEQSIAETACAFFSPDTTYIGIKVIFKNSNSNQVVYLDGGCSLGAYKFFPKRLNVVDRQVRDKDITLNFTYCINGELINKQSMELRSDSRILCNVTDKINCIKTKES